MGVGEYEAQQKVIGTGTQPATGYPATGYPNISDGAVTTTASPAKTSKPGVDPGAAPYQSHPQAYHEEFTRPPPQFHGYPQQPPPQTVYVQHHDHSTGVATGCCLGCLAALCCCCCI